MKKTKYMMSGGLAFSEEKEMQKLSSLAKKGWLLEKFAPFGYRLVKGEPQNLIYSLDYQMDADEDYFAYFEEANWTRVCTTANEIHIFCAPEGTKPIYSDKTTLIEKYELEKNKMKQLAAVALIVTVVLFLMKYLSHSYNWLPEIVGTISFILGLLSLIVLVFSGLPYLSFSAKVNKLHKS